MFHCPRVPGLVVVASREHREPGPGADGGVETGDVESGGLTTPGPGQTQPTLPYGIVNVSWTSE